MRIVVLYFDPGIGRMLQELMQWEGHTVVATHDANEVFRTIEDSAGPVLLFADNIQFSPVAREALPALTAMPALRRRARVIGVDVSSVLPLSEGVVDDFLTMPFTVEALLETIERNVGRADRVSERDKIRLLVGVRASHPSRGVTWR